MSEVAGHAEFFASRLRELGLTIVYEAGAESARVELPLSSEPFVTLGEPVRVERVGFYTLGHSRLKFCQPRAFFDLPAIDVTACRSIRDIERTLRRAWADVQRDLANAREWLERLGALHSIARSGTRLQLAESRAEVRSPTEVQLPSVGPLASRSLSKPTHRRLRPLASFEHSADLELALSSAASERAQAAAAPGTTVPPPASTCDEPRFAARVLLVSADPELRTQLETELYLRRIGVESFADAHKALAAFHLLSFDAVVSEIEMPRSDGFEVAACLRSVPGVQDLPIVLIDNRDNPRHRETASQVGACGYWSKPLRARELSEAVLELLESGGRRRFSRYPARLVVATHTQTREQELTELVARGGVCMRTKRDPPIGARDRYRLALPSGSTTVDVEGEIATRATLPGFASSMVGVRFLQFYGEGERRWIALIEELATRSEEKA